MEITTQQAVEHLQKALREDPEYYYGWQANIAMGFKDEYHKRTALGHHIDGQTIHEIANDGARRFLDILLLKIERI